jgi:hypothetical protein
MWIMSGSTRLPTHSWNDGFDCTVVSRASWTCASGAHYADERAVFYVFLAQPVFTQGIAFSGVEK